MRRLPLRWLVPIAMMGVALLGGAVAALVTALLFDQAMRASAEEETRRLARTLALALVEPVVQGDTWHAFQLARAAGVSYPDEPREVIVLGEDERVLAASLPLRFPLGQHVSAWPTELQRAVRQVHESPRGMTWLPWQRARVEDVLVMAEPIVGDEGVQLGTVLAIHPSGLSERQRLALFERLGLLALGTLVLLGIGGAALGWRLSRPIGALRDSMTHVGRQVSWSQVLQERAMQSLLTRRDEVGELARTYQAMLRQLDSQRVLERQLLEAERLSRVGQLAASIAHEVNNPIGGMLAALDNRRLRGGLDEASARLLDLVERGLHHIHATVQALLNEARGAQHGLQAQDLEDLHTLLAPVCEREGVTLLWHVPPPEIPLPALTVRQVLLNLCLNAVAAAGRDGQVSVHARSSPGAWWVAVANTGRVLDEQAFAALISGQHRASDGRVGLGLWVSARLLADAQGQLLLTSRQGKWSTVLEARFVSPCPDHAEKAE